MTLLKNKHPNRIRMTREEMIYQIIINIIMILVVLCCVVPLLYVIGMSLSSEGEMLEKPRRQNTGADCHGQRHDKPCA